MASLRHIKDLIAAGKYRYAAGIACLLVVDTLQLVFPLLIGKITDLLSEGKLDRQMVIYYALLVAALAAGIAVFRFFWRYLILGLSKRMEAALRERFYAHIQKLGASWFNNHKTGDLMAHATNDIGNISMAAGMGIIISIDSALIPVVAVTMMLKTAGLKLSLAAMTPVFVLMLSTFFFMRAMHRRVSDMQEAYSEMTEAARENFSGIRVIKAFARELKEIARFEKANMHNRKMNLRYIMLVNLMFPSVMTISALSFAIGLWFGGVLVIKGQLTLGQFISFNSYLGLLVWPISALGWAANIFQRCAVSLKRINTILDEVPDIKDVNVIPDFTVKGSIEFRNLSFTYPGAKTPVLKNINLRLDKGKTLAIVGRTGSGKSTLAGLISRLYNVPDGTIFIDGTDINRIPLSVLRSTQGVVPQDTFLFSSTIRDNIDFFSGKSEEEIIQAAKTAKIYDDIMDYPDKFMTQVGERGVTLSGGQKQRIAIARAILRDPAILILDDCLSAVDTRTEEGILRGLKELMKQRTSIIISHRISAIRDADEIIVLSNGEIAERGTHESLLKLEGEYYNLYQKQLLAEQIEGVE